MNYDNLNIGDKVRVLFDGTQPQNDGTYKDLTKQTFANNEILLAKGVGYDAKYIGEDVYGILYDIVDAITGSSTQIMTIGQDGESQPVSQGFGLGTREHEQVMLAYGYSNKVNKIIEIPGNDFAVISLKIPANLTHHAEQRFLEAYNGAVNIKVMSGILESNLPASISSLPVFNQKTALYNPSALSVFNDRGIHTSNPILGTILDTNIIDEINIYGTTGNARTATEASSSSVKGRYYPEGIYTLLIENLTNSPVTFTYIYDWHEY